MTGAARIVLRDWSSGKFSHYTIPPLSKATDPTPASAPELTSKKPVDAALEKAYEKDVSILDDIPTRKEKRKAGGLIRLTAGVADERPVSVEEAWAGLQDSDEEESEEGDEVEDGEERDDEAEDGEEGDDEVEDLDEGMAVDEEEEDEAADDEDDDEEEEVLSKKQKRKRTLEKSISERPAKKVAFAPRLPPKTSRSGPKRLGGAPVSSTLILSGKHALMITSAHQVDSSLKPVHTVVKKPEKSKSAVTGSNPVKSSLSVKGSAGGVAARPSSEVKAKVANVSTKAKAKATAEKPGNGPEAYDFGKFF